MKAFGEWYKNSGTAWSFPTKVRHEDVFKVAWKAALEWVRDELCPGNGMAYIREDIEEELEGK